jgi:hypothetical protein
MMVMVDLAQKLRMAEEGVDSEEVKCFLFN